MGAPEDPHTEKADEGRVPGEADGGARGPPTLRRRTRGECLGRLMGAPEDPLH